MAHTVAATSVVAAVGVLINDCRNVLHVPGTHAEISLYSQFETFLQSTIGAVAPAGTKNAFGFFQQANAAQTGVPDFRIQRGKELQGWVEVKAVIGKDLGNLTGHDELQLQRFVAGLDNVIYTNGWQWRLYQHGKQIGRDVVLGPNVLFDPKALPIAASSMAIDELVTLLDTFIAASPQSYLTPDAAVGALAARAKALKLALVEVGSAGAGAHLLQLESDFRALLFKNGVPFTWQKFVDSYVQLAVFGCLLWRLETGQEISLTQQVGVSVNLHPLLAQCLAILWSPQSRIEILDPLLEELCRTVNNVDPFIFAPPAQRGAGQKPYLPDPIVHAYEPFFSAYDPAARESTGVYYTPVEIVEHIVSGVSELLASALGVTDGLLDADARFLDPAAGTGTFLLGLANAVAAEATVAGLPPDQMVEQVLTQQTSAFEMSPGPYAIAHQRLEEALKSFGVKATARLPIYLADTLEAPATGALPTSGFGLAGVEIQHERTRADALKTAEKILVIFGNPPYERVLQGGGLEPFAVGLVDEIKQRTPAEYARDLKSTKDLFVAFWAWALWELQCPATRTATTASPRITARECHGMVAFITNRTWIVGRSLIGLRTLMQEGAKEIWVADLGGDARGAHGAKSFAGGDANVFGIQTGVAITWAVFDRSYTGATELHYRRIFGNKPAKLTELRSPFEPKLYQSLSVANGDPFMPNMWGASKVGKSPTLDALFADEPDTGLQTARDKKRYSPIGTDANEVLSVVQGARGKRFEGKLGEWSRLGVNERYAAWETAQGKRAGTVPRPSSLDVKKLRQFVYRPLDFRWIYDDPSWIDWYRPRLHAIYSGADVPSLVTIPRDHGNGPTVMHVEKLMDQHSFRGSDGGKGVFSLWHPHVHGAPLPDKRTPVTSGKRCGFSSIVYDWLDTLGRKGDVEAAYDYVLAVLSAPAYAQTYWRALETDPLRVPLTNDPKTFDSTAKLGARLRSAWTVKVARNPGVAWAGTAKTPALGASSRLAHSIRFANGRVITGVSDAAWGFQISNYAVLPNWFAGRSHWTATPSQAKTSLLVISAVQAIVDLVPALDMALQSATATC